MTLMNPTLHKAERSAFAPAVPAENIANPALSDFSNFFQASQATNRQEKNKVYRLRHAVYCEELSFEPCRPTGLEQDSFDQRALHYSLAEAQSGELAGTVRLIHCEEAPDPLPIEKYFAGRFTAPHLTPQCFPRQHVCEISRLAVAAKFRRRLKDITTQESPTSRCSTLPFNRFIAVGLYLMATAMCLEKGYYHGFVSIEPSLARILQRVGISFTQIGDVIEFNGKRAPYYLDGRQVIANLQPEYRQLMESLSNQLLSEPEQTTVSQQIPGSTNLQWAMT